MKKRNNRAFHRTTKVVLLSVMTISLLQPQGGAFADSGSSSTVSDQTKLAIAAGEMPAPGVAPPDPSKVKFTKEEAIAKMRELFPVLNKAEAQRVELGNNHSYPAPENQMIWDIQWNYQVGNSGYGFNSQVDAITGELISTYINSSIQENEAYYPPKFSREQALKTAKVFISKAAPSISLNDLQQDDTYKGMDNLALFGPVQYGFYFKVTKNGIPSEAESINVTIDGNGNVMQFNRPSDSLVYPSSSTTITQAEAEKKFNTGFDVGLYYIPIRKNGKVTDYILGWRPVDTGIYSIDALTGKQINYEGIDVPSSPVTYTEVPKNPDAFKPRNASGQLSAEEAAKLVLQVATIPEGRTMVRQSLSQYYMNPEQEVWSLAWGNSGPYYGGSTESSTEVDASTGEILQFRINNFGPPEQQKEEAVPSGATKLTKEAAKHKALDLVNRLYPNASTELKLVNRGEDWHLYNDGKQYRYEFVRYYKGTPVADSSVFINFDVYGELQSYNSNRITSLDKVTDIPVAKVTKDKAMEAYRNNYKLKLQYSRFGGYYGDNNYKKPELRLVYTPLPIDVTRAFEVLDASSGKWISIYESPQQQGTRIKPTDLKGHWAEKSLSTLVEYGVLTPDANGKVKPNEAVTVGEWLTMMAKSVTPYFESYYGNGERKAVAGISPDSSYYNVVNFAAERQWINKDTTLHPEEKLTREQLAVLLTSIVNYKKMANFLNKDISVSQFSDAATIIHRGEVAVAIKLGLLQGNNGKFSPQQTVSKAQAASVIMRLVELQGKTDQAIGQQRY